MRLLFDKLLLEHQINIKATFEVVQIWQCTSPHKLGNLYHSKTHNSPYHESLSINIGHFFVSSFYTSAQSSGMTSSMQVVTQLFSELSQLYITRGAESEQELKWKKNLTML
jgi:hypothetical protein